MLPLGKRVRLGALLYGLMLVSGNDAAIALAQHDARTQRRFVARMNRGARRLGLSCSHFASPSGIIDRRNHSCPLDLATLARLDLANPTVRRIVATRRARLPFPIKGGVLDLFNINPFISMGMPGITGVKTGLTEAAGRCYVITQRRGDRQLGRRPAQFAGPARPGPAALAGGLPGGALGLSAPARASAGGSSRSLIAAAAEWSQPDSNRRPPGCKPSALPTELWPHASESRRAAAD